MEDLLEYQNCNRYFDCFNIFNHPPNFGMNNAVVYLMAGEDLRLQRILSRSLEDFGLELQNDLRFKDLKVRLQSNTEFVSEGALNELMIAEHFVERFGAGSVELYPKLGESKTSGNLPKF